LQTIKLAQIGALAFAGHLTRRTALRSIPPRRRWHAINPATGTVTSG
jgi:hypothetical protein